MSHYQEVTFTTACNTFATIWEFEHVDAKIRFEQVGEPVSVDEQVLLKHAHTSNWLGSESGLFKNLYGPEMEVFVHSFYDTKKTQNLIAERVGRTTGDTPLRGQGVQNYWVLVSAQRDSDQFDENEMDKPVKVSDILSFISQFLRNKGPYGLKGLRRMFFRIDERACACLEREDLKWSLQNYGIVLADDELKTLISAFPSSQPGCSGLDYNNLLAAVDNLTSESRKQTIMDFYGRMKTLLGGNITVEGLAKVYDAKRHPSVYCGDRSEEEVFTEYIKNWGDLGHFIPIVPETWMDYYCDMSACVGRDDHFEKLILSPFNLSNST